MFRLISFHPLRYTASGMPQLTLLVLLALSLGGCGAPPPETGLYFPSDDAWESVDAASVGWDQAALDETLEFANAQRSSGVVMLLNGRILAEQYWDVATDPADERNVFRAMVAGKDSDGRNIEDVASAQKSVIAFLAGVAEGNRQLDLEAPVSQYLSEGWSKASPEQEAAITVRLLLSMASGLSEGLEYAGPAGEVWMYNTPAYSQMVGVLEAVTGKELNQLTSEWITSKIGMRDSKWWDRPWAPQVNTIGFTTSARDLARFGLLILANGKWGDVDLLGNPTYLDRALSASTAINESYGYLWWLNGGKTLGGGRNNTKTRPGPLIPAAPDDLVAAQGALNRKCYVAPSLGLVVTRLGDNPPAGGSFNQELWTRLMKAVPTS